MTPHRLRVPALVALVAAVAVFVATVPAFRHFFDVGVYRGAVRHWLLDGADLYAYLHEGTEYGFTYPPFAAVLMSPLALLPWPLAVAVSIAANAAATVVLLRVFLVPVARRRGWPMSVTWVVGGCAAVTFGPVVDTFSFGQVNLVLMALVLADLVALRRGHRFAGIGIGVAMAVKLTPGIFLLYLLVTRRLRVAAVAAATAVVATLAAAAIDPAASQEFWIHALWDTGRVGDLAYVSNQSLRGVVARLDAPGWWWLLAVAVVLAGWAVRATRTTGDPATGIVLTGVAGCLLSPVTWVHHLVWLLPALLLVADAPGHRWRRILAAVCYVLLCSSVVWLWAPQGQGPFGVLGSNAFVGIGLMLLVLVPVSDRHPVPSGQPRQPATP